MRNQVKTDNYWVVQDEASGQFLMMISGKESAPWSHWTYNVFHADQFSAKETANKRMRWAKYQLGRKDTLRTVAVREQRRAVFE